MKKSTAKVFAMVTCFVAIKIGLGYKNFQASNFLETPYPVPGYRHPGTAALPRPFQSLHEASSALPSKDCDFKSKLLNKAVRALDSGG